MSKSLEKKKVTTKNKKVVNKKSEKVEKVKESRIKKLTKKQLIIIVSIFAACIMVAVISISLLSDKKETEPEIKTCLVQFNTNGGLEIEATSLECGGTIKEPEIPEKSGFTFLGWYLNDKEYDFKSKIDNNVILEAKWEAQEGIKTVVVTFDTVGGSKIKPIELVKGEKLTKPVNPTMSGYKFLGWYQNYKAFDFNKPINENITLKAKWELKKTNDKNIETQTSSKKYKCQGSFRSDVPSKNVTVGYRDHVNWTWSTYGGYGGETADVCYITYKTSDSKIADVDKSGIITTKKAGTVYISECINDSETKTELVCFKGQLNIQDANDTTTVLSEYDNIVNKYLGVWYLEGYSDVYITISKYKMYYEAMEINPTQIDIYNGGIYPNGYGNMLISYEDWDSNLKKSNVTLDSRYISIKTPIATYKFTKTKGTKNKYSNSKFYEAIGTWYLYNKPEANFEIYKTGDDTDPRQNVSYCITPNSFNFTTLKYEGGSGGHLGCGSGTNNEILEKYGITISNGEMTITNSNGSVKLYKTKKVVSVNSVSLNKSSLNLKIGEEDNLTYSISPSNAYNQNVTWKSSNPAVATVSNGKVIAKGEGTTTITVKTNDGSYTDKCVVTVSTIKVDSISLNKDSLDLLKGYTFRLTATITPDNATNKYITWESSDRSVATVDNTGYVTAKGKGTAIITATTKDGGYTAKCTITVTNPPLKASGSAGVQTIVSSSGAARYVVVSVGASGGTGTYTYYSIKVYKDGTYIGTNDDTTKNKIYFTGNPNGVYTIEYEVRDSDGTVVTGSSKSTISGF